MKKPLQTFLWGLACILLSLPLSAQTISADGTLTGCMGLKGRYEIPSNVTAIGDYAFFQSDVTEVIVPPSVKSIGKLAFAYSYKLTKIEFKAGSQLSLIDEDAFSECTQLAQLVLPNGLKKIGARAFWLNSALSEITLPESLEALPPYCFQSCTELTEITLPKNLKVVGENAFAGCKSLVSVEMIGVDSIASKAFYGCRLLRTFDFPTTLRSIADSAFMKCELLAKVTLPKSVQKVGDKLFRGCRKLKSIDVDPSNPYFKSKDGILYSKDETVVYECPYTFASEKYQLPATVKVIRPYAFFDCPSVKGIAIPKTIEKIGLAALTNNGIAQFDYAGNAKYPHVDGCIYYQTEVEGKPVNVAMAYPSKRAGACKVIDETIMLAEGSFYGCDAMTSIVLPKSLQLIDTVAMAFTTGLSDISCYAVEPPQTKFDCFLGVDQSKVTAHVLSGSVYKYTQSGSWAYFIYGEDVANQAIASVYEMPEIRLMGNTYHIALRGNTAYRVYDTLGRLYSEGRPETDKTIEVEKGASLMFLTIVGQNGAPTTIKLL